MTINTGSTDWVPDSCTLPTAAQPIRVAEFDEYFTHAARTTHRLAPARLQVVLDPATEASARDLAGRESSCCSFFTFDFSTSTEGLMMDVEVPPAYVDVLDAFAARIETAIGARQ
ncbi:hypothetical protein LTV02_17900 [Nocardia yamanashiensis]|uniref:hypothetical protein n=1 Tax=Nocardia yamanashiensis TaxID=209247 RepID=UPI001E47F0C8|nr:hypothetical protein [Nocardia yamanashiensis]UGT45145.1 hypothetical protein LTV02_17900 [Nocardia yamanashiensis]